MAALSVLLLVLSLLLLADRLFFAGLIGLFVPAYAALLLSFLGFLFAFLLSRRVKHRVRSKSKLKRVKRAHALMVLNIAVCVASAALWLYDLIRLL